MIIDKTSRETLTAAEMDYGDELRFTLDDGARRRIVLLSSTAQIIDTNLPAPAEGRPLEGNPKGFTTLRIFCSLEIDGRPVTIVREIGTARSFDEPRELFGMRVWFDVADGVFDFLTDNHGGCRPRKAVRLAVWDARRGICPVLLHPWCPLPPGGLDIRQCYLGGDSWCGAYFGSEAHGGLDINHPAGTPLWAPIAFDDQYYFNAVAKGDNNNRWRGLHRWADGSTWVLQVHHVTAPRTPEHEPLEAGRHFADAAGVRVGCFEHSHFVFKVVEPGGQLDDAIALDPWLLFRQMYRDRRRVMAD